MAKTLTDDLRRIVLKRTRGKGFLTTAILRGPIPSSIGEALGVDETDATGGGIVSPLTEIEGMRQYHAEQSITSSDGLYVIVYAPIKTAYFRDAAGQSIVVNYTAEVRPPEE